MFVAPPGALGLPLRRLAAGQGDVAQVEDRKRVSLRVEDPTLKGHQVVAGEQQVEIPVAGRGLGGGINNRIKEHVSDTSLKTQIRSENAFWFRGSEHHDPDCCATRTRCAASMRLADGKRGKRLGPRGNNKARRPRDAQMSACQSVGGAGRQVTFNGALCKHQLGFEDSNSG